MKLYSAQQAHAAWCELWPRLKASLIAGKQFELTITEEKGTDPQRKKMWAMLRDVSRQVDWYGEKLDEDDWKNIFTASLYKQKTVPGIGGGFVVLGRPTSKMTKQEKSELIELIFAFGVERGVEFKDGATD